jgi:hypothetical protein
MTSPKVPEWPKLAGMHEAANILGVSGARVDQLMKADPAFPKPIARLRSTPVWVVADLVFYGLSRNKKAGPRKKVKPE